MGYAIQQTVTLVPETCCRCGVAFALPEFLVKARREDKSNFYCPNGHSMVYTTSEADRLREQLQAQMRTATQMAERARAAEAAEEKVTKELRRLKKRVSAGVCPCCKRTFNDLARHMKSKHKEFDDATGSK
jgi:hypothetical protein